MEQQNSTADSANDSSEEPNPLWRNEVHARVAGYRSRRGRRIEGAFSMRFPFPPMEAATRCSESEAPSPEFAECRSAADGAQNEIAAGPPPASCRLPEAV